MHNWYTLTNNHHIFCQGVLQGVLDIRRLQNTWVWVAQPNGCPTTFVIITNQKCQLYHKKTGKNLFVIKTA